MMLLAGTVPVEGLPLTVGEVSGDGEWLVIDGRRIPCTQGTAAMISAALATTEYLKIDRPHALVVGDTGKGSGSRQMYEYLIQKLDDISPSVLTLHYCLPDMGLTKKLCKSAEKCKKRPLMIADAASMYAAKAAGLAGAFDILTPDATEMAFLADPEAMHPAYINRHLFDMDITQTPQLAARAYAEGGAARCMLVKGAIDYVVMNGRVVEEIDAPDVPGLEAIGGTGDTITGMVSAFVYCGLESHEAGAIAARANRVAGLMANATPATRVWQIIQRLPDVFREHFCAWSNCCLMEEKNDRG